MTRGSAKALVVIALLIFSLGCAAQVATRTDSTTNVASNEKNISREPVSGVTPDLTGVLVTNNNQQSRVTLKANQRLVYTSFTLDNPPRIIVDLTASVSPEALGSTSVAEGAVRRVELSPVEGRKPLHRLKIDLAGETSYQIIREKNDLVIIVENPVLAQTGSADGTGRFERTAALPASSRTARITALDFEPVGKAGATRLSITSSAPLEPTITSKDRGQVLVLSLSPASIPDHLLRSLDARYFKSAVNYITPSRSGRNTVNITMKLRQVVPYHLSQEGLITYIDFNPSAVPAKKMVLRPAEAGGPKAVETAPRKMRKEPAQAKAEPEKESEVAVSPSGQQYTGQLISLDFQNADVHNILRLIGEVSGKNVVISDRVKGKVTLRLKDVPWDQALDIVLSSHDLGVEVTGNVLRIDESRKLAEEQKKRHVEEEVRKKEKEVLYTRILTPKYAAVNSMKELLDPLKGPQGSIRVVGNDIFIKDQEDNLQLMMDVFQKNDRVAQQILIEARIVEASTTFSQNLGVNWGGTWRDPRGTLGGLLGNNSLGGSLSLSGLHGASNHAVNVISPPPTGLAIGLHFSTPALDLDANLYAMEQTGQGQIISAPRILANNDQEVYISQGQSIPYETVGTATTASKIDFKEAKLELRVKPHIEENGRIISMEIKVTKETPDFARSARNPPINRREAFTKLMIRDGETVVIGGIIIDETAKTVNKVPGMHKLPIIGRLFKNKEILDTKVELLIFITAHIIPVKI
ncbi:MAG: type IV pilus secretin PilQ [Deltaproteobacteria bacterium]|nr:type IV pilus secretin PilQ [Deltaproteobacteria bacterium]